MQKLRQINYLGYMSGDIANNLAFSLQAMFLLIYYTNVVGLNPAPIGTMFLIVRVWDAFADLLAGRLVDMTHSRWGKFRPYLLFVSLPLLLSSVALFTMPNFDSDTAKYVYAYFTYTLLGTLYSLVNIPYGSLATVMTQDPVERSRLGTYRSVGPMLTIFAIVLLVAPQIQRLRGDSMALQTFFTTLTLSFVVLGYALYLFCFFTARERIHHDVPPVTLRKTFETVRQNRPLLILCGSNLVFLMGVFAIQGVQAFYASYILGGAGLMVPMLGATTVASFCAVPLVPRIVARIGKKRTFFIGGTGFAVVCVWIFFMPPVVPLFIATFFVLGLFQNMAMSLLFAFEADAVEYGQYVTGERTEGATYAVYSFFRKVSQAIGGSMTAYALSLGGFNAALPVQSEGALTAIRAAIGLGPALCALVGMLIFLPYPLTDTRLKEIVAVTRNREAEAAHAHGND
ncbi:glycoside-pentoside-hexuronide (GPH):cation symporter [Mobilicoccus massiliensis]|uniref:glycoside-pentoside-hexuronide (GPH):cation symporter n=1 Tax=Mobilicoccus massiliensis TaxID=1522310 RepID=UPI00058CCBD5|nr:glycoside-pentoside-hexuronide (GPH):cation symporter [Mobilicoccus massiliensis]